jgi:hypothetical protein
MLAVATDLDRTLLPNGSQQYDGSMEIFHRIIKNEKLKLIYVTGRNLKLVKEAIAEFHPPLPDFIVGEVGTKIYSRTNEDFVEDYQWIKHIGSVTKNWNIENFKQQLSLIRGLRIQEEEKQNEFKLSYYIDNLKDSDLIVREATSIIKSICRDATVIYSVDETKNKGLLDVLPRSATKVCGLEYLREKVGLEKEDIVYCGDSGNDTLPLTFGYKSILVRNAIPEVKNAVRQISTQKGIIDKLYTAKGYKKLNGYYVSGIIEGLIKFTVISPEYAE